jgi:hypothetical protein
LLALRDEYICGGVIMIFNFDKATATIFKLSRTTFVLLFAKQNKSRNVVTVDQHCHENRAGYSGPGF